MTGQIMKTLGNRDMELGPFKREFEESQTSGGWSNWRLTRDSQGVAWLLLDKKDTTTNVLSGDVLAELGDILTQLKKEHPKGLVLRSAKATNFCVGADINEFRELSDASASLDKLKAAHAVADKLARLSCPTVAVIHGNCFGGGLELALCCDYRLALPGARLGLPEIQLGLHPGLGGTARLTRLINPIEAMTLMLTGRSLSHDRAKKIGLVDTVVPERHVAKAVDAAIARKITRQKQGFKARLLNTWLVRRKAAGKMREKTAEKISLKDYPAPEALIALWQEHGGNAKKMRREEMKSFAQLLASDTAQNLIKVFFLREKMKRLCRSETASAMTPVAHVHVVGAGAMGGDIAIWCALQGLRVSLFDTQAATLAGTLGRARALCETKRFSSADTRALLDRLIPDLKNSGVGSADIVIEAVPENIDIKQKVYATIEPLMKEGALLATNTSSIPLEKLQTGLSDPGRFVGLHFFNPVAKMQLIEVVRHQAASSDALARACHFVGQISRLPAPVSSAPGFLVNRALTPYLIEAMLLLDEGVTAESIDRVAEDFGMPMGPIELADQVGLDICVHVADMLRERLPIAMPAVPDWLRKKVADGKLGRKSGEGLYLWENGKAKKSNGKPPAKVDTLDRLILPMLNACMACLREGVVEDEEILDGAMIFGTGFAPFRGGPMAYAHARGFEAVASALQALTEEHGERFAPDAGWTQTNTY